MKFANKESTELRQISKFKCVKREKHSPSRPEISLDTSYMCQPTLSTVSDVREGVFKTSCIHTYESSTAFTSFTMWTVVCRSLGKSLERDIFHTLSLYIDNLVTWRNLTEKESPYSCNDEFDDDDDDNNDDDDDDENSNVKGDDKKDNVGEEEDIVDEEDKVDESDTAEPEEDENDESDNVKDEDDDEDKIEADENDKFEDWVENAKYLGKDFLFIVDISANFSKLEVLMTISHTFKDMRRSDSEMYEHPSKVIE